MPSVSRDLATRLVLGVTRVKDIVSRSRVCLSQDTFVRANTTGSADITVGWGNPSDNAVNGDTWSSVGGAPTFSISGNEGQVTTTLSTVYCKLGPGQITDGEIVVRFSLSASAATAGVFLRYASSSNQYTLRVTGSQWTIVKTVSGTDTVLTTVTATQTVGTFYWMRLRVAGNQLLGKVWQAGTAEPAWQAAVTDGAFSAAGRYGLYIKLNSSTDIVSFDSLVVLGAPTPYHDIASRARIAAQVLRDVATRARIAGMPLRDIAARLRVNAQPLRDIATRLVLVTGTKVARDTATRSNLCIAQDTFTRNQTSGSATISDTNGWGQPSDGTVTGDTWSSSGTAVTTWSINSAGQGTVSTTLAGSPTYALLGSRTLSNVESFVQFSASALADGAGIVLRYSNANNHYRVQYQNGVFSIVRVVGGSVVTLASTSVLFSPNTNYNMRARVVNSTLLARFWPGDGSTEPVKWTITSYDGTYASGQFGLFLSAGTAGDSVTFANYVVFDGTAANSPLRDLVARLRVQAVAGRDLATRYVLGITPLRDLASRVRIASLQARDIGSRVKLQVVSLRDIQVRLLVKAPATFPQVRDLSCRFVLRPPAPLIGPLPTVPFAGLVPVVPLVTAPRLPYMVNGTVLDSQPTIMTAPVASSATLAAGTTFTLLFSNPSPLTQSLLTNGSVVSMQFGLSDGSVALGQVKLQAVLTGTTLAVAVTLTQTVTINRWVVTTQFL